jgi:hypothetical protein
MRFGLYCPYLYALSVLASTATVTHNARAVPTCTRLFLEVPTVPAVHVETGGGKPAQKRGAGFSHSRPWRNAVTMQQLKPMKVSDDGIYSQQGCIRIVAVSLVNEGLVNESF